MIGVESHLREKFIKVRNQSIKLCQPLKPEDYVVQPIVDVSPPKWHLAHTTWFFEQFLLIPNKSGYKVFDDDFSYLFNSYYETVGERVLRPNRGNMTRPGTDEIYKYRKYVDNQMLEFLVRNEINAALSNMLELGFHHEQQHQELLVTDIKFILGHNPLFPEYLTSGKEIPQRSNMDEEYIEVMGGLHSIGHRKNGFHFDNEKGVHNVFLHDFKILNRLITNGEYLEFMENGGYNNFEYWLSEGWEWANGLETNAPMYWHRMDDGWYRFTMHGLKPVIPSAPVTHVSYFEANAFANWKGKRLPTEFEWEAASNGLLEADVNQGNFVENDYLDPIAHQDGNNQMFGDAWEWTSSAYLPYPYYKTAESAIGEYNGKFMINQMVLRGGSCATPKDHIRNTYRNFWHPHLRWQFTGIRLAENI